MNSKQIHNLIKDWQLWPNICLEQPTLNCFTGLVNGLTNSNLLLTCFSKSTKNNDFSPALANKIKSKYVVRLNAPNAQSLFLNRTAEWHIHQCIAQYDICTPYNYRDPRDTYWIRPYIEGKTLNEVKIKSSNRIDNSLLKDIAKKLKLTHNIPLSKSWPKIIFKQRTDHYWHQILKQLSTNLSDKNKAIKNKLERSKLLLDAALKSTGHSLRLCHMDPNPNNWIIEDDNTYLIDWEYAAIGNPAWDLAVLCDTFELSESEQNAFLKYYGSSQVKRKQLDFAQRQMSYLSILWYCVQGISSHQNLLDSLIELENTISPESQKTLEFDDHDTQQAHS